MTAFLDLGRIDLDPDDPKARGVLLWLIAAPSPTGLPPSRPTDLSAVAPVAFTSSWAMSRG
ncbi:hypothetical protein ABZ726_24905 [Streptomyces hundungensis]|uniref:hypothetical protein n=1 Tax=Streptomyces hundungensis TaxID=1077946 RepID=UPI0033CA9D3E